MIADLDTGLSADHDTHTYAYYDAAYEWAIACDEHGEIVELGIGIVPHAMAPWAMLRVTPRALRDLAHRLVQIADNPHWWIPTDETP